MYLLICAVAMYKNDIKAKIEAGGFDWIRLMWLGKDAWLGTSSRSWHLSESCKKMHPHCSFEVVLLQPNPAR